MANPLLISNTISSLHFSLLSLLKLCCSDVIKVYPKLRLRQIFVSAFIKILRSDFEKASTEQYGASKKGKNMK